MLTAKALLLTMLASYQLDTSTINQEQAFCMALNVYHEARGESLAGQFAVAHTTYNRVKSKRFPDNVCDVVKQSYIEENGQPVKNQCQFSWYCDGKPDVIVLQKDGKTVSKNVDSFKRAIVVAFMVMSGKSRDNTQGATFYYNPKKARPSWALAFEETNRVGNHRFMRRPTS